MNDTTRSDKFVPPLPEPTHQERLRALAKEWTEEARKHPPYSGLAKLLTAQVRAVLAGADALDKKYKGKQK